jgi:serine/threonine protein phosphatase PrpC
VSLAIQVAARTDIGCVRSNNEDNFGYDAGHGIFAVCDGMGGQASGEVASRIAVDSLLAYFRQELANADAESSGIAASPTPLSHAITLANRAIREAAARNSAHYGMGSTVACVLIDDSLVSIGHVGDSRVYLVRENAIRQLTQDHSFVMEKVSLGLISPAEAEESKLQNIITRALGPEELVEPDVEDMIAAADDVLVLATDGLTKLIGKQEILATVRQASDLESACSRLICQAKDMGGDDNITCLLIRFVKEKWHQALGRRLRLWGTNNGSVVSHI